MEKPKNLWFKEFFSPHEAHLHRIKKYIKKKKTKYQKVIIVDTYSFGRCLILDKEMQSAESDEFIYHECLVHPAMLLCDNPKRVVILGGGEGATLREVLKHKTVEKVTMVDIDGEVVEFCKKYFKKWHMGSFENEKTELIIGDAKDYIEKTNEKFDVIIADLPSPIEGGPAFSLYSIEYYKTLKQKLKDDGVFVTQSGSASSVQIKVHLLIQSTLKQVFETVRSYYAYVTSFDVPWAFTICSKKDPLNFTAEEIDNRINQRINGELCFYDGISHIGLFHIPKYIRNLLEEEKKVITSKRPVYLYKK